MRPPSTTSSQSRANFDQGDNAASGGHASEYDMASVSQTSSKKRRLERGSEVADVQRDVGVLPAVASLKANEQVLDSLDSILGLMVRALTAVLTCY